MDIANLITFASLSLLAFTILFLICLWLARRAGNRQAGHMLYSARYIQNLEGARVNRLRETKADRLKKKREARIAKIRIHHYNDRS